MQGSLSRVEREGYPVRNGGCTDHTDSIRAAVRSALKGVEASDDYKSDVGSLSSLIGDEIEALAQTKRGGREMLAQADRLGLLGGSDCPRSTMRAVHDILG